MERVTDNVELNFPARMADGRQFTDYNPNCMFNNTLSNGASSWVYRNFLTQNAEEIRKSLHEVAESQTACSNCESNTVIPDKIIQNCSPTGCTYQMNDENGVGIARSNTFNQ